MWKFKPENWKHIPFDRETAIGGAVVAALLLVGAFWSGSEEQAHPESQASVSLNMIDMLPSLPAPTVVVQRPDPEPLARPHLDWAAEQTLVELPMALDEVQAIFAEARERVPAFVDEARGWESKFRLIAERFQGTTDHADFLRNRFEELVLSEATLESAFRRSLSQYQRAITSVEGELLVRLRSDLPDFDGNPLSLSESDVDALPSFHGIAHQANEFIALDLAGTLAREVASAVITDLAGRAGVQLAIFAGALPQTEERDWVQFLAEQGLGWLLDQFVIQPAYEAAFDPSGKLTDQIVTQLNDIERAVLSGDDTHPGWDTRLAEYARQRAAWREAVLLEWLRTENGGLR